LVYKGFTLGEMNRSEDALVAFDAIIARFGDATEAELRLQVAKALVNKGRLLADLKRDFGGAREVYERALVLCPDDLIAKINLAWVLLEMEDVQSAAVMIKEATNLPEPGPSLLRAGLALANANFGSGMEHLTHALALQLTEEGTPFFEDLLRLIRLAVARGFGERLIGWFEETGNSEVYAPVFAALIAHSRGVRFLRDVNPETRTIAKRFFDFLEGPAALLEGPISKKGQPKPKRSHPRKRANT
jgi:tetratricopeptide (TPR) repeat protein